MSTPSESTTFLSIPPTPAPETPRGPHTELDDAADVERAEGEPEALTPQESNGPATAILEPVDTPATIPALPLAPRDPADRPFAAPQRSTPGNPDVWWRRLFRR